MDDRTKPRWAHSLLVAAGAAACTLAVACGGRSTADSTTPDSSVSVISVQTDDAGGPAETSTSIDSGTVGMLLVDSGSIDTGATAQCDVGSFPGEVPVSHRPSGSTCPARSAGSGVGTCSFDAGAACTADSDCTAGSNGRCYAAHVLTPQIPPPPSCPTPVCSYDACESDTDCPSGVPCDCRATVSIEANACATGSNCRTDSDCGPTGYCSPGGHMDITCSQPIFFCHTPADTCVNDSDCCAPRQCSFDTTLGHFACGAACVPPP